MGARARVRAVVFCVGLQPNTGFAIVCSVCVCARAVCHLEFCSRLLNSPLGARVCVNICPAGAHSCTTPEPFFLLILIVRPIYIH
jgi:hypothetical protein